MQDIPLHEIAHARTGDKGNLVNISLIAYRAEDYALLAQQVTCERVAEHFAHRHPGSVRRYLLPRLGAMNFVLEDVLDGGVNDSLNLDMHGKALSFHLLAMKVRVGAGGVTAAKPGGVPSSGTVRSGAAHPTDAAP